MHANFCVNMQKYYRNITSLPCLVSLPASSLGKHCQTPKTQFVASVRTDLKMIRDKFDDDWIGWNTKADRQ